MKAIGKNRKLLLGAFACAFAVSAGVAVGGATVQAQAATQPDFISSAYVTLSEDIVVKYKLTVPEGYTTATAKYTYKGKEYTDTKTVTAGENVLAFSEVTPVNIGENVAVSVTLSGDGKEDITDTVETFSVADYCKTLLNSAPSSFDTLKTDAQYDAMRALAANLVSYSGALQEYVGAENTAMGNLVTAAQNAIVKQSVPTETDLKFSTGNESESVAWAGANLLLDSRVNMAFYFYCTENLESVTLDITKDGQTVTVDTFTEAGKGATSGKTVYCGVWEGVSVVDFDKTFTAQLKLNGTAIGNSVTYSVKSYVYSMQKSTNDKMKSLSVALYNYGVAAREYIDALAQDTTQNIEISTTIPVTNLADSLSDPTVVSSLSEVKGWGTIAGRGRIASLTTDGEYFYALAYGSATLDEATGKYYASFRIVKMDENFTVLGYSADFTGPATGGQYGGFEYNTPLWLKDGYAYSYKATGETVRVSVSALTDSSSAVALETAPSVSFGGIEDVTTVNAVYYNAQTDKFAVVSGQNTLSVYAASDLSSAQKTMDLSQKGGSSGWRIAGDETALYLTSSNDGGFNPDILVYDWALNKIGTTNAGITAEAVDTGNTGKPGNSKVEGIAVKDGKLYLSLIGWGPLPEKASIFETTFSVTENRSFGEIALSDYKYTMSAESASGGYINSVGSYIYNIIEKDGYLYIAGGTISNGSGTLSISRYNLNTKSIVAKTSTFSWDNRGSENVAMFACGGNLYVYTSDGWQSVPLYFAAGAAFTAVDTLPINLGSESNAQAESNKTKFVNIWYWEEEQKTVLYRSDKWIILLDKDGNEVKSWSVDDLIAGNTVPRFGGDDAGYVYFTSNAQGAVKPTVTVFDLRSYEQKTIVLPSAAENSTSSSKIGSVFGYNGSVYFSVLQWGSPSGSNIQKVSYANVKTAPSVDLGEAIELATQNGVTLTLEKESTITVRDLSTTVKGVVSDGRYFYLACRSEGGKTFLVKMRKNGAIVGKTAAFTGTGEAWEDKTYLLYQGGYIYAYGETNGESVYRIAADAFTSDGSATVEKAALPFAAGVSVSAAAYEKTSGRYAVRSGNDLYLIGSDGAVYKTEQWAVGGTPCGVVCDEHYIYLMYENNGGIAFNVFDWNGNKVGEFKQDGLISETAYANIASMVIEDGKVYIFAKPWGNTSMYLYTVTLSSLNFVKAA